MLGGNIERTLLAGRPSCFFANQHATAAEERVLGLVRSWMRSSAHLIALPCEDGQSGPDCHGASCKIRFRTRIALPCADDCARNARSVAFSSTHAATGQGRRQPHSHAASRSKSRAKFGGQGFAARSRSRRMPDGEKFGQVRTPRGEFPVHASPGGTPMSAS